MNLTEAAVRAAQAVSVTGDETIIPNMCPDGIDPGRWAAMVVQILTNGRPKQFYDMPREWRAR